MEGSVQLMYRDSPGELPASYEVPGGGELVLSSVFARIDGSGAASAFAPCLDLLSQDGKIISRVAVTKTLEVGDLARVTWAPFLRRQRPAESTILQAYAGQHTAADFTFNSAAYIASGFPLNSTFTKLSSTSLLDISLTADFTSNLSAPNTIYCALFIDGVLEEAAGVTVGRATSFVTAGWRKVQGIGLSSGAPFASGAHTLEVKVAHDVGASNSTLRSSTSVDLEIIEYEPPV